MSSVVTTAQCKLAGLSPAVTTSQYSLAELYLVALTAHSKLARAVLSSNYYIVKATHQLPVGFLWLSFGNVNVDKSSSVWSKVIFCCCVYVWNV